MRAGRQRRGGERPRLKPPVPDAIRGDEGRPVPAVDAVLGALDRYPPLGNPGHQCLPVRAGLDGVGETDQVGRLVRHHDRVADRLGRERINRVAGAVTGDDLEEVRSEEHTSELQSLAYLVCRLLLEKKKKKIQYT